MCTLVPSMFLCCTTFLCFLHPFLRCSVIFGFLWSPRRSMNKCRPQPRQRITFAQSNAIQTVQTTTFQRSISRFRWCPATMWKLERVRAGGNRSLNCLQTAIVCGRRGRRACIIIQTVVYVGQEDFLPLLRARGQLTPLKCIMCAYVGMLGVLYTICNVCELWGVSACICVWAADCMLHLIKAVNKNVTNVRRFRMVEEKGERAGERALEAYASDFITINLM